MGNRRVSMFVQNGVTMDNRVLKEARVLRDAGWTVTIVGKRTTPDFAAEEDFEGITILRVGGDQRLRYDWLDWFEARKAGINASGAALLKAGYFPGKTKAVATRGTRLAQAILSKGFAGIYRLGARTFNRVEPLTYLYDWDQAVCGIEDRIGADVWHAHDIDTLPTALRLRARFGGRVIYDAHEYWLDCNNVYNRFELATWTTLEATLIRKADRVLTVSKSIAEVLSKRYRVPEPALVLNTPNYHAVTKNRSLREKFDIADDAYIIIYVGLITHKRGYEQLIDALPKIDEGVLVFLGPGDQAYIEKLKQQALKNQVGDRVVFAGSVNPDEIQTYTASADVGVVVGQRGALSYECALPSKYFEYVFAGLPVATSAFVEMESLSQTYGLGETFDERNPASIAAALEKIRAEKANYSGPDWDERRRQLIEKYAWSSHKNELLQVYDALTGETPHAQV